LSFCGADFGTVRPTAVVVDRQFGNKDNLSVTLFEFFKKLALLVNSWSVGRPFTAKIQVDAANDRK
jgi:hypothetical protein